MTKETNHIIISDPMVEAVLAWVCDDVLPAYDIPSDVPRNDPELPDSCRAALTAAIGAGGQVVADSLWVPAKPEHKKIGWTYDFDQTERLSHTAEKATGYEATMEVIEFVMAEADRRHKSALSQPHPVDERVVRAVFETSDGQVTGNTDAPIKRIEHQDDGSITVIIDYWPTTTCPADERVVEALRKIEYCLTKDSLCEAEKIDDALKAVRRLIAAKEGR